MTSESDLNQRQPKGLPCKVSNRGLLDSSLPVMRDPLGDPLYGFVRDTRCVKAISAAVLRTAIDAMHDAFLVVAELPHLADPGSGTSSSQSWTRCLGLGAGAAQAICASAERAEQRR